MSFFKRVWDKFTPAGQAPAPSRPQQAAPEPSKPQEPPKRVTEPTNPRGDNATRERIREVYTDIFVILYQRHILRQIDWSEIGSIVSPPALKFADEFEILKILPPPEPDIHTMERFWNSLRPINQPLAFELITRSDTMYFRLSFPKGSSPLIERQLSLHFPGCNLIPEEPEEVFLYPPFTSLSFAPRNSAQWFDTSDVARDPYAALFALLDDPENEADMVFQVICTPVTNEAIQMLGELLEIEEPGLPPEMFLPHAPGYLHNVLTTVSRKPTLPYKWYEENICQKIHSYDDFAQNKLKKLVLEELSNQNKLAKQSIEMKRRLEKKQPPWVACINIFSDDMQQVLRMYTGFLRQYETSEQEWKYAPIDENLDPITHPIPHWNLMATSELANLAHFPTKEVKAERLELASTKRAIPPDSYIID